MMQWLSKHDYEKQISKCFHCITTQENKGGVRSPKQNHVNMVKIRKTDKGFVNQR